MLRIVEHFHDTDLGRQRQGNEDSLFVRAPLFVVADGMGGAQAGEVASEMAVQAFEGGLPDQAPAEGLVETVRAANRRIHERSRNERGRAGMGTTLTAAYLTTGDEVIVAHVGDSRAYLLRDGDLVRLTHDHSLVGELVARGKLTEEQAESHPQRSVITRALGPEPEVDVDLEAFQARAGDVFLLCSDGLTSMVPEARVKEILRGDGSLEQRGRELIAAANRAGGRDNITVILFRLEAAGERAGALASAGPGRSAGGEQAGPTASAPTRETATQGGIAPEAPTGEHPAVSERGTGAATTTTAVEEPPPVPATAQHRSAATAGSTPGRRRRRLPRLVRTLGVLVVLVLPLLIAGWLASRAVYFVGTDTQHGRAITIYRGVPYELPGGIRLYERFYPSGVTIDAVPQSRREIFTNHKLRSRDDAEDLVIALERGELNR